MWFDSLEGPPEALGIYWFFSISAQIVAEAEVLEKSTLAWGDSPSENHLNIAVAHYTGGRDLYVRQRTEEELLITPKN
jgi:hypothetical protein